MEFDPSDSMRIKEIADLMFEALEGISDLCPTEEAALGEFIEFSKKKEKVILLAMDGSGSIRGMIGAKSRYTGRVLDIWQIVVDPDFRRCGMGQALIEALDTWAAGQSLATLTVGIADEAGLTPLAQVDLYPDPLPKLDQLALMKDHPIAFFSAIGFTLLGVLPEAAGDGKHLFWMGRKVR